MSGFTECSYLLICISYTAPNVVSNLMVTAHSTRLLFVTWERPVTTASVDSIVQLTYNVLVNGIHHNSTDNAITNISIPELAPNTSYQIEVIYRPS